MVCAMDKAKALYALGKVLNPALGRVIERGERGQELEEWGLRPHRPDPGTPMAMDDEDGWAATIPDGLAGTVMYPIMNATDALASVNVVLSAAAKTAPFRHHTPSFLASCRTAFESSAQAIWVLSSDDRNVRRARAAGLALVGVEHARDYHSEAIKAHDNKLYSLPDETYKSSQRRLGFHQEEVDRLTALPHENGRSYKDLVRKAANWLQDNPPMHTTDIDGKHFPTILKQEYRVCSSFTHGHAWPIHLVDGPSEMFAMMADAIMSAVISTECAVALYEAHATDPAVTRTHKYPERLQPSIDGWHSRFV